MQSNKEFFKNRVNKIVDYIIENKCTTGEVAEALGLTRGIVNSDLQKHLNLIVDVDKIDQVKTILKNNRKKGFNQYKIVNDYVIIYLKKRDGRIFESYIDLDDLEKLIELNWSWFAAYMPDVDNHYAKHTQYLGIVEGKPKYYVWILDRIIMNAKEHEYVDHINHNTLDNRKKNLRVCANDENTKHKKSKNKNNTSGHRNVCWNKRMHKWMVQLQINGKNTILKYFDYEDLNEAGAYAEKMRNEIYGEFAGDN